MRQQGNRASASPFLVYGSHMDLSDLEFWAFLAVAVPGLFLPVAIVCWKGRPVVPIALLSLVFWPGALILALRLRRRQDL